MHHDPPVAMAELSEGSRVPSYWSACGERSTRLGRNQGGNDPPAARVGGSDRVSTRQGWRFPPLLRFQVMVRFGVWQAVCI